MLKGKAKKPHFFGYMFHKFRLGTMISIARDVLNEFVGDTSFKLFVSLGNVVQASVSLELLIVRIPKNDWLTA